MRKFILFSLPGMLFLLGLQACTVSYSTSGASISPEVKTVSVDYFDNYAPIVDPGLSQQLTEAIKDKFINQTNLQMVRDGGDLHFDGKITSYEAKPQSLSGDQQVLSNRLTIAIEVKYTNAVEPETNFEKRFSRYEDYDANQSLDAVKASLQDDIIEQLVQDVFNESVVNW